MPETVQKIFANSYLSYETPPRKRISFPGEIVSYLRIPTAIRYLRDPLPPRRSWHFLRPGAQAICRIMHGIRRGPAETSIGFSVLRQRRALLVSRPIAYFVTLPHSLLHRSSRTEYLQGNNFDKS